MIPGIKNYWKRLALRIGKWSEGASVAKKKGILLGMLLVGGGGCFYKIMTVFDRKPMPAAISIHHLKVPRHVTAEEAITAMNSVKSKRVNRKRHGRCLSPDSLVDSVPAIEKRYQSQAKNK